MLSATDENRNRESVFYKDEEKTLIRRILNYKDNYFAWIADFTLPTTNNLSERSLRSSKTKQKVSGQFKNIDRAMDYIKNGDNLGQALSKTKLNFPDKDIVADLRIYAELDNFEEALDRLANDWLDESAEAVEQKASILNMVAMFAISGIIAWAVFGVFEMQDQITSAMG